MQLKFFMLHSDINVLFFRIKILAALFNKRIIHQRGLQRKWFRLIVKKLCQPKKKPHFYKEDSFPKIRFA